MNKTFVSCFSSDFLSLTTITELFSFSDFWVNRRHQFNHVVVIKPFFFFFCTCSLVDLSQAVFCPPKPGSFPYMSQSVLFFYRSFDIIFVKCLYILICDGDGSEVFVICFFFFWLTSNWHMIGVTV